MGMGWDGKEVVEIGEDGNQNIVPATYLCVTVASFVRQLTVHVYVWYVCVNQIHMELYFLSSQKSRPSLFGMPMIIPCDAVTTHQDLYQQVWSRVSYLVTPLPPSDTAAAPNHAQDWSV